MKLVSYGQLGSERFGIVHPNSTQIIDVNHADSTMPFDLLTFLKAPYWDKVKRLVNNLSTIPESALIPLSNVRLGAPLPNPGQIIAVGLNYRNHAQEGGRISPTKPMLFGKGINSVTGPFDNVIFHKEVEKLDYEVELGVIIGSKCQKILASEAYNFILGYTVLNDVSARCAQFSDQQFFRGKSMDTFAPFGPWIITKDEIKDPMNLQLTCKVNDQIRQNGNTKDMIFNISFLIEYISRNITLMPGDIIATGTPDGVGYFNNCLLKKGDIVELEIENIGTIKNKIV